MPKYADFVLSRIDWRQIEDRLARYRSIATSFPLDTLRAAGPQPYFCHGLAWRLGTWGPSSEPAFQVFNGLLKEGSSLPGWIGRASGLPDPDFSSFWSSLWELQVAQWLSAQGLEPGWSRSGPDLTVRLPFGPGFVECYTYHKSFGVSDFLQEVLSRIHPRLRLDHRFFLQYSIPTGAARVEFLEGLISPLLDTHTIRELESAAQRKYPVPVPVPPGGTGGFIFMDGDDLDAYDPAVGAPLGAAGDPDYYLEIAIKEVLGAKKNSNEMAGSRPNLLAANLALSADFQVATSLRSWPVLRPTDFMATYDSVLLAVCGIDEILEPPRYRVYLNPNDDPSHPFSRLRDLPPAS